MEKSTAEAAAVNATSLQRIVLKVAHIISGLGQGGAEAVLWRLVKATADRYSHLVVSLSPDRYYESRLRSVGAEVLVLGMPRGRVTALGLWRLFRVLRAFSPDVVQTWMYHANFLGSVVSLLSGYPCLWGLHNAALDPSRVKWTTRAVAAVCSPLSHLVPRVVVSCSQAGARSHVRMGYAAQRMRVIPNGYDVEAFAPDPVGGLRVRRSIDVPDDAHVVGMVARWDPIKDHATFLEAAARVAAQDPRVRFVLCGEGISTANEELSMLVKHHDLLDKVRLLGPRDDIATVFSAFDLHVLSSRSEAFPNVVAEAMACEVSCVVTDVGDASFIVGPTGWVVASGRPDLLADAMGQGILSLAAGGRGREARLRIVREFSIANMVARYSALFKLAAFGSGPEDAAVV